jgi:ERF superfamily
MHRSSDSIGNISGALAKAQAELTNPEKSLVAIIRSPFPREADRTFRYAPLSSGLDIIRKNLGRHEIATIQSTAIDKEAGLLRLTTILAHSSGEWVSSEWPVCLISDIASAQRMGAALTYARRYALFTLVGIAGEDDLDAPDLGADPNPEAQIPRPPDHRKQVNGQGLPAQARAPNNGKSPSSATRTVLGVQLSASLRESLIGQLAAINSADEAAAWAHRNLPAKNKLMAADAKMVEERFQARLLQMNQQVSAKETSAAPPAPAWMPDEPTPAGLPHDVPTGASASVAATPATQRANAMGRKRSPSSSVQALGKPLRLRDKDHRRYVLRQACLVCGRVPSDPHHLTFTQPRALGRRVSDEFIVPVCRVHHRELHRSGNEAAWWQKFNIDPIPVALRLWQHTRSDDRTSPDARTELKASTQGEAPDGVPKAPA